MPHSCATERINTNASLTLATIEGRPMHLRPFILLARDRLILLAVMSLMPILVVFYMSTAGHFTDIGVFWHHFSGNAPVARDTYPLLYGWNILYIYLGATLGFAPTFGAKAQASGASGMGGGLNSARFLLTRPTSRISALLRPFAIATVALAIIPALNLLLLLGWLSLVHAPSLGHLVALLELVPSASTLGPHPSFFTLLVASHFLRYSLSGYALGLCSYAALTASQWLTLSASSWLRFLGATPLFALYCGPLLMIHAGALRSTVLMLPEKGASLAVQPSLVAIVLHLAFAAAALCASWSLIRRTEL
jgi:hypothetical protein